MLTSSFPPTVPCSGSAFAPADPSDQFPAFVATIRCSDSLLPLTPHFVSFAWRYRPYAVCSLLSHTAPLRQARANFREQPLTFRAEAAGPHRFLVPPNSTVPRSLTPMRPPRQAITTLRFRLLLYPRHRLPQLMPFGAQSRSPLAPCVRFGACVTPAPRNNRFRLLTSFTRRASTRSGHTQGFRLYYILPPYPGFAWRTGKSICPCASLRVCHIS